MKQQVLLFIIYKYFAKILENLEKTFSRLLPAIAPSGTIVPGSRGLSCGKSLGKGEGESWIVNEG